MICKSGKNFNMFCGFPIDFSCTFANWLRVVACDVEKVWK